MSRLSTNDKVWLAKNYPDLVVVERPDFSLVQGQFHFKRSYKEVTITDNYSIRLELSDNSKKLPIITEIAGRLELVLKNHPEFKGNLAELHIYPSKRLCLAAPQELRLNLLPKFNIKNYFSNYVAPYFYSQSYFEEYETWPWEHLPHDTFGVVVWYIENASIPGAARETIATLRELANRGNYKAQRIIARATQHESFSPKAKCLCGSGKQHMRCHRSLMNLALAFKYPSTAN